MKYYVSNIYDLNQETPLYEEPSRVQISSFLMDFWKRNLEIGIFNINKLYRVFENTLLVSLIE
jgi:hypothetical protein